MLFEIGANAIIDGYYREAVASFASSLERFFEYFVIVKLLHEKCPRHEIDAAWKEVSSQSERQLGAFIFLYSQTYHQPPKLMPKRKVEFRNSVIHKGKIPSRDEAIDYGQAVLEVVRPLMDQMKASFPDGEQEAVFSHLSDASKNDVGVSVTTLCIPTILSLVVDAQERKHLVEALEALRLRRERWGVA